MRIGVLYGPKSREDAFYLANSPPELLSVTHICDTLEGLGLASDVIDPCSGTFVEELADCDVAFVNLHGEFGEDGRLQGLLDYVGKPYTGSGVAASAVGVDKLLSKLVLRGAGLQTPRHVALDPRERPDAAIRRIQAGLRPPWILKPVAGGSSIGVALAREPETLLALLAKLPPAAEVPHFVEEFVVGRTITVAILEMEPGDATALAALEVTQEAEFYDQETKLDRGLAAPHYSEPLDLSPETYKRVEQVALRTYSLLGCRGFARVDMRLSDQTPFVLEINTVPGLSIRSNFLAAAHRSGLSVEDVVLALLRCALHPPTEAAQRPASVTKWEPN